MADSPMLSRSGGMRTQLQKKSQQNVPSVGPKELQKAPLTDHIRGGFEVLAWKQLTIPGDNTVYDEVLHKVFKGNRNSIFK